MPIGKNSLKRVTNNGYSNVTTSAPDMENSTVDLVEEAAKLTEERLAPKTPEGKEAAKKAIDEKVIVDDLKGRATMDFVKAEAKITEDK